MYVEPEKEKEDGLVHVEVIQIRDYNKPVPFDFILFSKGNTHTLYTGELVLVKSFVLAKSTEDLLLNASKKIVGQTLVSSYNDNYPAPPMVMVPPSMSRATPPEQKKVVKKPFKPFFYTKELANGNTLFAFQETEEISKPILEAKSDVKLYLDKEAHTLTIKSEGKESSMFSFDPKTGGVFLPKIYLKVLGLTML